MFKNKKLYKIYKKFIKDNESVLETKFRLRRDFTNSLYTIINLNPELVNKYYGESDKVATPAINEYIKTVDGFFASNNMSEFIAIRKIERVDDFNWKVEFGFSLFNTKKRANITLIIGILAIAAIIATIIIF